MRKEETIIVWGKDSNVRVIQSSGDRNIFVGLGPCGQGQSTFPRGIIDGESS